MNDMPDTTTLDGKAIADLAEQLNQLLRLRTFPIGMKLFEDIAENGSDTRPPSTRQGKNLFHLPIGHPVPNGRLHPRHHYRKCPAVLKL